MFYDQDSIDEALDHFVFEKAEALLKLLFVSGIALKLGNEKCDFTADFVKGDDSIFDDCGDAVCRLRASGFRTRLRGCGRRCELLHLGWRQCLCGMGIGKRNLSSGGNCQRESCKCERMPEKCRHGSDSFKKRLNLIQT